MKYVLSSKGNCRESSLRTGLQRFLKIRHDFVRRSHSIQLPCLLQNNQVLCQWAIGIVAGIGPYPIYNCICLRSIVAKLESNFRNIFKSGTHLHNGRQTRVKLLFADVQHFFVFTIVIIPADKYSDFSPPFW